MWWVTHAPLDIGLIFFSGNHDEGLETKFPASIQALFPSCIYLQDSGARLFGVHFFSSFLTDSNCFTAVAVTVTFTVVFSFCSCCCCRYVVAFVAVAVGVLLPKRSV